MLPFKGVPLYFRINKKEGGGLKISLRTFKKLKGLKCGSQAPGERLDLGKEPQASPWAALSPWRQVPCSFPPGLRVSLHPLRTRICRVWVWDPASPTHPPTPEEEDPRRIGMLIPALSQRAPVWGGNNACLYPSSFQSPHAPAPWEPPSSPLNHLLGRCPQTEGQVSITGMRENTTGTSCSLPIH